MPSPSQSPGAGPPACTSSAAGDRIGRALGLPLVFIRAKQASARRVRQHSKNGRNEMKRRDVLKVAGAGFAAAAIAKPAIAQSMPELKWRCTSSFPKSLDTLYGRSEEHTSELQSLTNLVCRLLLEKKKLYTRE